MPIPHAAVVIPCFPVYPFSTGSAETLYFRFGAPVAIAVESAMESIIIPIRPLIKFSTLSVSTTASGPGNIAPSLYTSLSMFTTAVSFGLLVRCGCPFWSMLPPEAHTHDITSFCAPFGGFKVRGMIHPHVVLLSLLSATASEVNWAQVVGGFPIPAFARSAVFVKRG